MTKQSHPPPHDRAVTPIPPTQPQSHPSHPLNHPPTADRPYPPDQSHTHRTRTHASTHKCTQQISHTHTKQTTDQTPPTPIHPPTAAAAAGRGYGQCCYRLAQRCIRSPTPVQCSSLPQTSPPPWPHHPRALTLMPPPAPPSATHAPSRPPWPRHPCTLNKAHQ